jgi:hypothetical protein
MSSRDLADAFAECLVTEDADGAHDLMAPWLADRWTVPALERAWRAAGKGKAAAEEWDLKMVLGDYEDLRIPDGSGPPTEPFPDELTMSRFRDWLRIRFFAANADHDADEPVFEGWIATAQAGGDLVIGHLEFHEAS